MFQFSNFQFALLIPLTRGQLCTYEWRHDVRHNNIQYNDVQLNDTQYNRKCDTAQHYAEQGRITTGLDAEYRIVLTVSV